MGRKKNKNKSSGAKKASDGEKASLQRKLENRPEPEALANKNIVPDTKRAPSIQANASRLKKRMSSHLVEEKLAARPDPKDLASKGVADPEAKVSAALAPAVASLEKATRANHVKNLLESRPSEKELENMGVQAHTNTAPKLRSVQRTLEKRLAADAVKVLLDTRPDASELKDSGVMPDLDTVNPVADRLQGPVLELEHKLRKDKVAQRLSSRPGKGELGAVLAEDSVAPMLQPARSILKAEVAGLSAPVQSRQQHGRRRRALGGGEDVVGERRSVVV